MIKRFAAWASAELREIFRRGPAQDDDVVAAVTQAREEAARLEALRIRLEVKQRRFGKV